MKQLKFMLAAATAISLATAAQADTQLVKTEISSENFDAENITLNDTAAVLDLGFTYEGATAADNESVVVAGGADNTANALQVNTGTDPLLRKIDPTTGNAVALDATKKVYIDTMVQFTVTPEGDTVTAGDNDKLMIYLKEVPEVKAEDGTVETPASTKLMVKAAKYTPANPLPPARPASFEVVDAEITGVTVEPKKWYRLVVISSLNAAGFAQFTIQLAAEGQELATLRNTAGLLATDDTVFPSLLGTDATSLDKVGFAGEGKVDELVFSKDVEQETSADFTFTIALGEGVSSVTYTIGGESVKITEETAVPNLDKDTEIVVTAEAKDWYKITAGTGTYTVTDDETITVSATKTAAVVDGKIEVTESTKPADVGITTGSFAADTTTRAELNKVLTWATAKASADASAAGALVGQLDFTDETETPAEQAYLLNCNPNNAAELKAAKDNFKFEAFDPLNPPTAGDFAAKGYNGTVTIQGAATLGTWGAPAANSKFYRAVLTK